MKKSNLSQRGRHLNYHRSGLRKEASQLLIFPFPYRSKVNNHSIPELNPIWNWDYFFSTICLVPFVLSSISFFFPFLLSFRFFFSFSFSFYYLGSYTIYFSSVYLSKSKVNLWLYSPTQWLRLPLSLLVITHFFIFCILVHICILYFINMFSLFLK